jgi:hypothetical protein
MKCHEVISEQAAGKLRIGDFTVVIQQHVLDQSRDRRIRARDIDHALRKLPLIADQIQQIEPGQRIWIRDPNTGVSMAMRRGIDPQRLYFFTVYKNRTFVSGNAEEIDLPDQPINELSFLGSPCTKDCSGHRAGYEWFLRKRRNPNSWSPSFNKGAALAKAGK